MLGIWNGIYLQWRKRLCGESVQMQDLTSVSQQWFYQFLKVKCRCRIDSRSVVALFCSFCSKQTCTRTEQHCILHSYSEPKARCLDIIQPLQIPLHSLRICPLGIQIIILIRLRKLLQLLLPLEVKSRHGISFCFADYWFSSGWTTPFGC